MRWAGTAATTRLRPIGAFHCVEQCCHLPFLVNYQPGAYCPHHRRPATCPQPGGWVGRCPAGVCLGQLFRVGPMGREYGDAPSGRLFALNPPDRVDQRLQLTPFPFMVLRGLVLGNGSAQCAAHGIHRMRPHDQEAVVHRWLPAPQVLRQWQGPPLGGFGERPCGLAAAAPRLDEPLATSHP